MDEVGAEGDPKDTTEVQEVETPHEYGRRGLGDNFPAPSPDTRSVTHRPGPRYSKQATGYRLNLSSDVGSLVAEPLLSILSITGVDDMRSERREWMRDVVGTGTAGQPSVAAVMMYQSHLSLQDIVS